MSRVDHHHHNATAEGAALAFVAVIALCGGVLVAPGAVLVFAADRFLGLSLDVAQLWTFAGVATVALIGALAGAARSASKGATCFFYGGLAAAAFILVARFGFHALWPAELVAAFTGQR